MVGDHIFTSAAETAWLIDQAWECANSHDPDVVKTLWDTISGPYIDGRSKMAAENGVICEHVWAAGRLSVQSLPTQVMAAIFIYLVI